MFTKPGSKAQPKREDAKFLKTFNSGRIDVNRDFETHDWPGTYWARYVGHRHDTGPFSLPASWRIASIAVHTERLKKRTDDQADADTGEGGLNLAA